ncbi:hypothetical protein [Klebsiella pneumoniae IS39]|nr:hypothetical protein [Klebsiella pneumoniae IS39]
MAASTRVCRAKSALRLKARRGGGFPEKHLQHQDGEMNNSDQRNEESG